MNMYDRLNKLTFLYICRIFFKSKNLTWRDVQHLIVETSSLEGLTDSHIVNNGVGRKGKRLNYTYTMCQTYLSRSN